MVPQEWLKVETLIPHMPRLTGSPLYRSKAHLTPQCQGMPLCLVIERRVHYS